MYKVTLALVVILSTLIAGTLVAKGYVKISAPKILPAGSVLTMNGTSTPSNATHTHCEVAVTVNGGHYSLAMPGKPGDYTTWIFHGTLNDSIKAGPNKVTTKYTCFSPTNSTGPDFEYHHSINITGR
jgi:hypothetical protein